MIIETATGLVCLAEGCNKPGSHATRVVSHMGGVERLRYFVVFCESHFQIHDMLTKPGAIALTESNTRAP